MSTLAVNNILPAVGSGVSVTGLIPDVQFSLRNKIINGDMNIAQRGTSFAAIASDAYSLDRWKFYNASAVVGTVTQQADAPSNNEFQNSYRFAVTTADTSIAAGDLTTIRQVVEGYNARDLIGKTFTLSFWVRSSKTGTHCVGLRNSGGDRSYVSEYTVSAANTWEFKIITVSSGLITAGTWNWTTGSGLNLDWTLACGSTYQTTAGAWQTGNYLATANQVNCLDTVGNIFAITGVQLEVGAVATPFEHRPYGTELALCQRYYYRMAPALTDACLSDSGYATATTTSRAIVRFPVTLRTRPTALEQSGTAGDYTLRFQGSSAACNAVPTHGTSGVATTADYAMVSCSVASGLTTGDAVILTASNTTAYLGWSAEL